MAHSPSIETWLDQLYGPLGILARRNYKKCPMPLFDSAASLARAIQLAFNWNQAEEGDQFWIAVYLLASGQSNHEYITDQVRDLWKEHLRLKERFYDNPNG